MSDIHPTAIVDDSARLGPDCTIGPWSVVGPGVVLGAGNVVHAHVVLQGPLEAGEKNEFYPFVVVGGAPQHRQDKGEDGRVVLGARNVLREQVTIHRATSQGNAETRIGDDLLLETRIGDDNLLMVACHLAHDVQLGSHCNIANAAQLAGHVQLGDGVFVGGGAAVHQFVRIGEGAMIAAGAGVAMDVPPFALACGDRARLYGVNRVGLRRTGASAETITALRRAYRLLFRQSQPWRQQLPLVEEELGQLPHVARLLAFLHSPGPRGITRHRETDRPPG